MDPSPSLLEAIAEVCKWHDRLTISHPTRKLKDGSRQEIIPTEIPRAIRHGEIQVPVKLIDQVTNAVLELDE